MVMSEASSDLESSSKKMVLVVCNRCKEKLQVKVDLEEMKQNLKGGLFSVEVPHGAPNSPHSTIFYLSLNADQVQVRDQVTADRIVESIGNGNNRMQSGLVRELESSELEQVKAPAPLSIDENRIDITNWMFSLSIFLIGLGLALWVNYDVSSSLILASYASLGTTQGFRYFLNRRKLTKATKTRPILLEELEGATFQDPENSLLILTNKKMSRLLSIYRVIRGNTPEVPLTLTNTALCQSIPLLYMNLGNSMALLAVEHVTHGSKKQREVWERPQISERVFETMKHHCTMVESGLDAGGIEFEKTLAPPELSQLLRLSSHESDG